MSVLYFLENIRNPVLDAVFSVITLMGDELFFMSIALILFWCVDKYEGLYVLIVGFIGTLLNQFLKITFKVPRPWVKNPNFTIVESSREAASGYSFPSGHTQSSVGIFSSLFCWNKNKILRIILIVFSVLVPFSRLYLGVHTPLDVGVSFLLAVGLAVGLFPFFSKCKENPKKLYPVLAVLTFLSFAFVIFVTVFPFSKDVYLKENVGNLISAQKNAFTLFGCMLGLDVVYYVDLKVLNFSTKAVWWQQIIKILGGLALVICVKTGLKTPLEYIIGYEYIARGVRYFIIVITAGIIWPWLFTLFCKKKEEKN